MFLARNYLSIHPHKLSARGRKFVTIGVTPNSGTPSTCRLLDYSTVSISAHVSKEYPLCSKLVL